MPYSYTCVLIKCFMRRFVWDTTKRLVFVCFSVTGWTKAEEYSKYILFNQTLYNRLAVIKPEIYDIKIFNTHLVEFLIKLSHVYLTYTPIVLTKITMHVNYESYCIYFASCMRTWFIFWLSQSKHKLTTHFSKEQAYACLCNFHTLIGKRITLD